MSEPRSFTDRLAGRTFWVTAALALFCMVGVILIAFRDQFFGSTRWCHQHAASAEASPSESCRDSERACQFEREQRCHKSPDHLTSSCALEGSPPASLAPCR